MNKLYLILLLFVFTIIHNNLSAQGCVAIRQMSSCGGNTAGALLKKGDWQLNTGYRYFESYKHFKGLEEQTERVELNTEVINNSHFLDITGTYAVSDQWNLNITLPLVYNLRSSLYEHGRASRHNSESYGLGDMRVSMNYWFFPDNNKGNFAAGLGIKLPTGDHNAMDEFFNVGPGGTSEIRPVDQSIQPGDGGIGITAEIQGFKTILKRLAVYGNAFYLINPRETNGTRTYRETLSPILANEAISSVPDQYLLRGGFSYANIFHHLTTSIGARVEGVTVKDLIGGSNGFRRPGYVISIEPALVYQRGKFTIGAALPVALVRNRQQSLTDKETETNLGIPRHGDAAFADYVFNISLSYKILKHKE